MSTGAEAVIVAGTLTVVLCLLGVTIFFLFRQKRRQKQVAQIGEGASVQASVPMQTSEAPAELHEGCASSCQAPVLENTYIRELAAHVPFGELEG